MAGRVKQKSVLSGVITGASAPRGSLGAEIPIMMPDSIMWQVTTCVNRLCGVLGDFDLAESVGRFDQHSLQAALQETQVADTMELSEDASHSC